MTFQRVVEASGLTKVELSQLYGVSRQSIYCWHHSGGARDGSLLARQAETITNALVTLIDTKRLPLPAMGKAARRVGIARLATTLQNLKPVPVK